MTRKCLAKAVALLGALAFHAAAASAGTVHVDATDDIFLAGLSTIPSFTGGAGTLPPSIDVIAGQTVVLAATGFVNCCEPNPGGNGPDGNGGGSSIAGYGNVGSYSGPAFALAGFFLGGPSNTPFVIGSALTLVVPTGATKLFFGLPDAYGFYGNPGWYYDNSGGFDVTYSATPVPAALPLLASGLGALGLLGWRRRRKALAA